MTTEEQREEMIQEITSMLRTTAFTVEYQVKKKPKGIRVIFEVSQEEMDEMTKRVTKKTQEDVQ